MIKELRATASFIGPIEEFKDLKTCIYFDIEIIASNFMASELLEYHLILKMEMTRVLVLINLIPG